MPPALTYTLLFLCAAAFVFGYWVGDRKKPRWARKFAKYATVIQLASLAACYLVLRPGSGDDGSAAMQAAREQGRPVFVDLYSNF